MSLEGLKLKLPEDKERVNKLRNKLAEYAKRESEIKRKIENQNPNWHPELIGSVHKDSLGYFKLVVLSELFLQKEIDTYELSLELEEEIQRFNVDDYNMACGVINDYCKTGGKNCSGGTGLKNNFF